MTWMDWSILFQGVLTLACAVMLLFIFYAAGMAKRTECILAVLGFLSFAAQRVLFLVEDPDLNWQAVTIWRKIVFQTLTPILFFGSLLLAARRAKRLRSSAYGKKILEDLGAATRLIKRRAGVV